MPNVMEETDIDRVADSVDAMMADDAEAATIKRLMQPGETGGQDLSNGGTVGAATITPMQNGVKMAKGRAAARRAWMWDGTETLLPLAWNPNGTQHDAARRYLLKRHCLCCHAGGFKGAQCPNCVSSNCNECGASSDRTKVIANFYLTKEEVPFPARFYGNINCFLPFCARKDGRGFITEQDMRIHARSRHRMEYQAFQEAAAATDGSQVAELQRVVNSLMLERGLASQDSATDDAPAIEAPVDNGPKEEPRTKLVKVPGKQRRIRVPI